MISNAAAYNNRGNAHSDLKNYDQAIADYNRALQLDPNDAIAYFNRSLLHEKLGNTEPDIADARRAEELFCGQGSPNCQKARNQLQDLQR